MLGLLIRIESVMAHGGLLHSDADQTLGGCLHLPGLGREGRAHHVSFPAGELHIPGLQEGDSSARKQGQNKV